MIRKAQCADGAAGSVTKVGSGPGGGDVGEAGEEGGAGAGGEGGEGGAEGVVAGVEAGAVLRVGRVEPAAVAEEPVAGTPATVFGRWQIDTFQNSVAAEFESFFG